MKVLIVLVALAGIATAVDYCALPTCLDKHIACNNKGVCHYSLSYLRNGIYFNCGTEFQRRLS